MSRPGSRRISAAVLAAALALAALALAAGAFAQSATPERGFLGFQYEYFEETADEGRFRVRRLYPGGPAEAAGLLEDDVITAVNQASFRFEDQAEVGRAFEWVRPGDEIELDVMRGQTSLQVVLVATGLPEKISRQNDEQLERLTQQRAMSTLFRLASEGGVRIEIADDGNGELAVTLPDLDLEAVEPILEILEGDLFRPLLENTETGSYVLFLDEEKTFRLRPAP